MTTPPRPNARARSCAPRRPVHRFLPPPAALSLVLLALATPATAMYCGNRLVSEGDTSATVRRRCGEPLQIDRYPRSVTRGVFDERLGAYVEHSVVVQVERWVYGRGPRRLVQELLFENGRLVNTETRGYGD